METIRLTRESDVMIIKQALKSIKVAISDLEQKFDETFNSSQPNQTYTEHKVLGRMQK